MGDVIDDDPTIGEPWNAIGIKKYDKAASDRGTCFVCKGKVLKNTFRMDFRVKVSMAMGDQPRFHPACAAGLPCGSRDRDIRVIRMWLRDPSLEHDARTMLEGVLALLV